MLLVRLLLNLGVSSFIDDAARGSIRHVRHLKFFFLVSIPEDMTPPDLQPSIILIDCPRLFLAHLASLST